jgi:predicted amidophosphoribosyltransferase
VKGAFQANPYLVNGRSVLLVDDVTTTGATLESAARDLLVAGASHVYGLTLARSIRKGFEK